MAAKRGPKNPLSDQHKAAMQQGRIEGRIVREYLEALQAETRAERLSPRDIRQRLQQVTEERSHGNPVTQLKLVQERLNLEEMLLRIEHQPDSEELEARFVEVARRYSDRQGISYRAWREVGVPATVLTRAGISRTARAS